MSLVGESQNRWIKTKTRVANSKSVKLTFRQAIHTCNATGSVNFVIVDIDTRGFAITLTLTTIFAFVGINNRAEQSEARQKTQEGANRADGVAPCTATTQSQEGDDDKCDDGDNKRH